MEGESAIQAVHGPTLDRAAREKKEPSAEVREAVDAMRADYEHQLDARYAAARGYVDAVIHPEETAEVLALALRTAMHNDGPHLGAFVLPPQPPPAR
jgi:3-methylcrotonyl-CoA carboxylase beta subunit